MRSGPRCWWRARRRACRPPLPRRWRRSCWLWSCCSSSGGRAPCSRWPSPASRRRAAVIWLGRAHCSRMPDTAMRRRAPMSLSGRWCSGLVVGLAAAGLSRMMYGIEDFFERAADSLDVVAGDWRRRGRHRRAVFSARTGRRLRQHRRAAARQCADRPAARDPGLQSR